MNQVLSLKTAKFDILNEDENPNNQIYGQSLLIWLKNTLEDKFEFSEVESEDWGWYCYIEFNNRKYMLGASTFYEEGDDATEELEWAFQVDKERTLKEMLLFRERMNENDECYHYFRKFFEEQNDIGVIKESNA